MYKLCIYAVLKLLTRQKNDKKGKLKIYDYNGMPTSLNFRIITRAAEVLMLRTQIEEA